MPAAPAARQELSIGQSDAAERQDWDVGDGMLSEEALRPGGRATSFFSKTGAKTAKVALLAAASIYFCWGVTGDSRSGDADGEFARAESPAPTIVDTVLPDRSYFLRRDVVGAEMDAVGLDRQGDIGAGVDEESSCRLPVLSCQLCSRIALTASWARNSRSRVGRSFSRSWM